MGEKRDKKRKKRSCDDDEEGLSNWKLGMVVGAVVICFAMLYPTVFHPMLMGFFGGSPSPKPVQQSRPPMHPGMGSRPGGGGPRGDVHPAMRMAQSQAETAQGQTGGGRGMYTWMLPIYTVGVVVFLLYTLFKSKSKKKKRSKYEDSSDEEDYTGNYDKGGKGGKKKLKGLQARLRQTEEAMAKILEQLEKVQAEGLLLVEQKEEDIGVDEVKPEGAHEREDLQESSEVEDVEEEEIEQPSTSRVHLAAEEVSRQGDQYISDLEKALKDFKILSEEYENAKSGKDRRGDAEYSTSESEKNSQSEESSDEESSEQSASETESEEEEALPPPPPKKTKKKSQKKKTTKMIEEEVERESVIRSKESSGGARRRVKKTD